MSIPVNIRSISKNGGVPLIEIKLDELIPLPPPYDRIEEQPGFKRIPPERNAQISCDLDGVSALSIPLPKNRVEEKEIIDRFVAGLKKLFSRRHNWAFLKPLILTIDYCARCQSCSLACPVYEASGGKEIYRPTYRSEVFRRLVRRYTKPLGRLRARLGLGGIKLDWTIISRLYELSYRCTLCRRCAQACPMGLDNGLVTRELRKLFSQELGWTPKELHEKGTVLQMKTGSSTGMNPKVVKENVEILSWPENIAAFSILMNASGRSWTLSSEDIGYDGVNYGLFYDDVQLARIAIRHMKIAKKLGVKKVVMGECGHEHKALMTIADRIIPPELAIPRESSMAFLENLVFSGRIKFNPAKNDFPVTLHDPCNIVRNLGIVEPQRRILRYLCPQFREMTPHGVDNYCCGGGSGFAVMSANNFRDWRVAVAGRVKFKQIIEAFADRPEAEVKKYICAPCSNCKGQIRDILDYYGAGEKSGIYYGGLVELIVNAMEDLREPYIRFE